MSRVRITNWYEDANEVAFALSQLRSQGVKAAIVRDKESGMSAVFRYDAERLFALLKGDKRVFDTWKKE